MRNIPGFSKIPALHLVLENSGRNRIFCFVVLLFSRCSQLLYLFVHRQRPEIPILTMTQLLAFNCTRVCLTACLQVYRLRCKIEVQKKNENEMFSQMWSYLLQ